MKNTWFILCGVALMFLATMVIAADKKPSAPADARAGVEELSKQVEGLQARLKELEQRLAKLEKAKDKPGPFVAPLTVLPPVTRNQNPISGSFADPVHPPKIWREGECNGWKFYTIPLSFSGEAATAGPVPLAAESSVPR